MILASFFEKMENAEAEKDVKFNFNAYLLNDVLLFWALSARLVLKLQRSAQRVEKFSKILLAYHNTHHFMLSSSP